MRIPVGHMSKIIHIFNPVEQVGFDALIHSWLRTASVAICKWMNFYEHERLIGLQYGFDTQCSFSILLKLFGVTSAVDWVQVTFSNLILRR